MYIRKPMQNPIPQTAAIPLQDRIDRIFEARANTAAPPVSLKEKFAKVAMIRASKLEPDMKAVALALQYSADGLNRSNMRNTAVSEETGLSIETVNAALFGLKKIGLIRSDMDGTIYMCPELAWRKADMIEESST